MITGRDPCGQGLATAAPETPSFARRFLAGRPLPAPHPVVAAAQILLGVGLSCLMALLCLGALGGVVVLVLYLTK